MERIFDVANIDQLLSWIIQYSMHMRIDLPTVTVQSYHDTRMKQLDCLRSAKYSTSSVLKRSLFKTRPPKIITWPGGALLRARKIASPSKGRLYWRGALIRADTVVHARQLCLHCVVWRGI